VGWNKNSVFMFLISLAISTLFTIFREPMPIEMAYRSPYWNSLYFMTNRFISTMIVLYCVTKSKPMEKSKSK
jgi:hypothetical protein